MRCKSCERKQRPAIGTPMRGYCDSCGWALQYVDGHETAQLHPSLALAMLAVAESSTMDEWRYRRDGNDLRIQKTAVEIANILGVPIPPDVKEEPR